MFYQQNVIWTVCQPIIYNNAMKNRMLYEHTIYQPIIILTECYMIDDGIINKYCLISLKKYHMQNRIMVWMNNDVTWKKYLPAYNYL